MAVRAFFGPGCAFAADDLPSLDFSRFTRDTTRWMPTLSTGFDSYLQSYSLATSDTTEVVAEYQVTAGLEGQAARRATHRWRVRAEASYGSELVRERLEAEYRLQRQAGDSLFRLGGFFWARQYQQETDYSLSSDNMEGRLNGRLYPLTGHGVQLELRGWAGFLTYDTPSSLEVDYQDRGVAAFLKSRRPDLGGWQVGLRAAGRAYPDSARIDRRVLSLEGQYDWQDAGGQVFRAFHKTDRRLIEDETARPSAWAHWTEAEALIAAGTGFVFLDLQAEVWAYDQDMSAYYDSWRVKAVTGYQWGDILTATWRLGLANEHLAADDSPETYTQFGLRGGVESYGHQVSGSLMLEYGRRVYRDSALEIEDDPDTVGTESFDLYSDFNYWEIWIMANWYLTDHFSLDLLASYEPESHTEQTDDMALGYGSLRLVWRP